MNHNKNFYNFLGKILIVIAGVMAITQSLGALAAHYTDSIDNQYRLKSESENFVVPSTIGNGMGLDYIYNIRDCEEQKMIIFGNSTSIIGLNELDDYQLVKACSGAASINSCWVMDSFLSDNNITLNENDLVKLDLSVVTFKRTAFKNEVLVSALEYNDLYQVNKDCSIERKPFYLLKKFFTLNARAVEKACEYLQCKMSEGTYDSLFTANINDYSQYHKLISINDSCKASVIRFIEKYKDCIIVDLMYMSDALENSEAGKQFNDYVDEELIPYLIENRIPYIDSRKVVDEDCFVDNAHLNYKGQCQYEEFVNTKLKEVIY